jgi:hypothetical protein
MIFASSCQIKSDPNKMEMILFEPVCRIDTINNNTINTYKIVSYLADGYYNSAAHEAKIDSFVCSIQDSTWSAYDQCIIQIYQKSKYTNNEYIAKNPRDLDRYSQDNDFLYRYVWANGIFYSKIYLKGKSHYDDLMCNEKR